ncbi:sensor histidine kinase [Halobacterium sp. CBA1126]|uniref:sensor histidine kinase n=1 Tax=Halobacterium sp. CBA1126 TaxID=2668074 RepID=UPI0037439870
MGRRRRRGGRPDARRRLGSVVADRDRLSQLLENLFRNSLDHAGAGVAVRVVPTEDGFAVKDDGPGLPGDGHEDLFERGYTTEDDGTGFGLYIVRKIANAHGWTVEAATSDDGGARFEFSGVERGARAPQ